MTATSQLEREFTLVSTALAQAELRLKDIQSASVDHVAVHTQHDALHARENEARAEQAKKAAMAHEKLRGELNTVVARVSQIAHAQKKLKEDASSNAATSVPAKTPAVGVRASKHSF